MSTFAKQKTGFTRFNISLTQNVWTKLTTQCPHRCSIMFSPSNPSFVTAPGLDAPANNPTLPTQYQYTPNTLNDNVASAIVKGPWWGFTSVAGVVVEVSEELEHCECDYDDYNK